MSIDSNLQNTIETTMLRRAWYVVAQSRDIRANRLHRVTLCDVPLVLFRDRSSTVRVLHAMCPHRGADLSKGYLKDDCVVCPYHGWRFDAEGQCAFVPTQPEHPAKASVQRFRVVEQDGFVWVCLFDDAPDISTIPSLMALDTPGMSTFWVSRRVAVPMLWWIENMLDVTHVPFTHAQTFGGDAAPLDNVHIELFERAGFKATMEMTQSYTWLTRLLYRQISELSMKVTIYHWMPGVTCFEVKLHGGRRTQLLWSLVRPIDEHHCETWLGIGRDYWNIPGTRWLTDPVGRWFANRVLDEDERLGTEQMIAPTTLHMAQPRSVHADEVCLTFLKLYRACLKKEEQLDHAQPPREHTS